MEEDFRIYKGIVDKENNPFTCRSWREECNAGNPIGSGKEFQPTAIENFKKFLDKTDKVTDAKNRHTEKYACFQAIRWECAIVKNGMIITTEKWLKYNPVATKHVKKQSESNQPSNFKNKSKNSIIRKESTSEKLFWSENELVEKLKSYDVSRTIDNYLVKDMLTKMSPSDILEKFTFGSSIYRRFTHENPKSQYSNWAKTQGANKIIERLDSVKSQIEYDNILFEIADSLVLSWSKRNLDNNSTKMNIGISLKVMNLLFKHLVFSQLQNNIKLKEYLHVPWDSYTLRPIRKVWTALPIIKKTSGQGLVETTEQYQKLHEFITNICNKAGVNRINYEFLAWDKEH